MTCGNSSQPFAKAVDRVRKGLRTTKYVEKCEESTIRDAKGCENEDSTYLLLPRTSYSSSWRRIVDGPIRPIEVFNHRRV